MTKDEALKLAFEYIYDCDKEDPLVEIIRQALEQPEQEPVAWVKIKDGEITHAELSDGSGVDMSLRDWTPLYTSPPKREWVGLTDEDLMACLGPEAVRVPPGWRGLARAIEAKLKEKNYDH